MVNETEIVWVQIASLKTYLKDEWGIFCGYVEFFLTIYLTMISFDMQIIVQLVVGVSFADWTKKNEMI